MDITDDVERMSKLWDLSGGEYNSWLHPDEDAWRQARQSSIGASDAAAVMGISPWKTEAQLWDEKANGKMLDFHNSDTVRGHRSENHILELYGIETGRKIFSGERIILLSNHNLFMSCTLDGIDFTDENNPIIIEVKSVKFSHGEWSDDKIPDYYFTQLLHQLAVTGWGEAILLVRFTRNEGWESVSERMYHVKREDVQDQIDKLVRKESKFWNEYVVNKKRPPCRMPTL